MRDRRRQSDARHLHAADDHEEEIEQYVDDTCDHQKEERAPGVAHRPQNRTAEVVEHDAGNRTEADPDVGARLRQDIFRRLHENQQRSCHQQTDDHQQNSTEESHGHHGLNRPGNASPVAGPEVACSQHICADGNADENIDDQRIQVHRGSDGGHRFMRRVVADDNQIRRIEQQLKNIGEHQRQREEHDLPEQRSVTHIDLIFVCSHDFSEDSCRAGCQGGNIASSGGIERRGTSFFGKFSRKRVPLLS